MRSAYQLSASRLPRGLNSAVDPDLGGIAAGLLGQGVQLAEHVERALVGLIGIRHPPVAHLAMRCKVRSR
jgi:hypothetical protein